MSDCLLLLLLLSACGLAEEQDTIATIEVGPLHVQDRNLPNGNIIFTNPSSHAPLIFECCVFKKRLNYQQKVKTKWLLGGVPLDRLLKRKENAVLIGSVQLDDSYKCKLLISRTTNLAVYVRLNQLQNISCEMSLVEYFNNGTHIPVFNTNMMNDSVQSQYFRASFSFFNRDTALNLRFLISMSVVAACLGVILAGVFWLCGWEQMVELKNDVCHKVGIPTPNVTTPVPLIVQRTQEDVERMEEENKEGKDNALSQA